MRDIKFRAWDGEIMWYPETKTADDEFTHIIFFNREFVVGRTIKWGLYQDRLDNRLVSGEYHEIMQYTGLKDRNGKEIYEGDIILYVVYHPVTGKQNFKNIVSYDNGKACFAVEYLDGEYDYFGSEVFLSTCEVIGNIYEHPNLLADKAHGE